MYRQALFGQSQRPTQFYTGDDQVVLDGARLSDDDSFGGENRNKRNFRIFDPVSIDVSSPCPPERHTFGTDVVRGYMDAPGLEDYVDDIDEYPEYGDQTNVNGTGDPSHWDRGTCVLRFREIWRSLMPLKK